MWPCAWRCWRRWRCICRTGDDLAKQPTRLIPFQPYIVGGHVAFLVVVIVVAFGLLSPFLAVRTIDILFERHWLTLIPEWLSLVLQGNELTLFLAIGFAYPVCLCAALATWMIHERQARRYLRQRGR